jgi:gliding motility-associated-like protein
LLAQLTNTQPVVCFGDSSGSATFNAIGGVPPYQYGLGNGAFQGSPTLSNLAAGTYLGIVEDNVGCRDTVSFTVGEPPALQLNVIAQRNVDCQGNATGALTVSGNGGVLPYDYAFDGGPFGADTSWSTLSAGTYVVQVRDANGCITPLSVSITEPSALMLQIDSLLMVDCYGNASGVAFLGGMGGSAPYEFALPGTGTPFGPSSVIDSLSQGTYLLVMRDDSSCLDTVAATITQPDSLSARVTNRVDVDCLGNNTGELSVAGTGGTLPFQYAINNGSFGSSPTFDSLFANFFTLTVRDDNGCLASVDTLITTPTGLTAGIDVLISVACNGDSTGSVLMAAQGGTAPYRYTYDGVTFTSNPFFGNLPAQTDTVTLIDVNECIVPIPYTITQPAPLNLSISEQADVACQGDSTGFVRLLASGGVQPYLFVLDNVQTFSDTLIDGLPAGPHLITMIDDSSCSVDLSFTISEPSPLVASIAVQKNIDCYDNRNGAVEVLANGGVGPYWVALDTMAFDTLFRFDSLPAGAYLITVQDDSACTTTLPVTITQPDSLTLDTLLTLDIACAGDTAGLISLLAQGGTRPYQFALDSGLYQLDSVFSGLAAGDYSLTVQDDSACLAQMSVRLREPSPLQLTLLEQQMVDCYGNANGRLAFSAQGGQPGYQFQLDQGPPVPDSVFAPLAPGFYRVTLLDANGCNQFQDSLQITQPDSLTLDLAATDVRCFGGQDGQIEALLAGGTAPFEINWNSTPPQMGLIAQNLSIGRYLAEVLDANGCSVSGSTELTQPPLLRLSLVNQTDAYCDRDNGSAQVAATGGTGAYQFAWSGGTGLRAAVAPNLFGGDYLVSVTDSSGCRDSLIVPIGNTPPPTARFRTEPSTDGSLLLSQAEVLFINESEGAVAYEWDFGASGAKSLAANPSYRYEEEGSYTIRLTAFNDYYLCPSSYELTLNVIFDGAVAVANAFTPNHDGVNDWFPIAHAGVVSGSWAVYNRWGREVRRYGSIEDRWDGLNMSGTPVPEGVYVYVLQARLNSGAEVTKSGTVTLIR